MLTRGVKLKIVPPNSFEIAHRRDQSNYLDMNKLKENLRVYLQLIVICGNDSRTISSRNMSGYTYVKLYLGL